LGILLLACAFLILFLSYGIIKSKSKGNTMRPIIGITCGTNSTDNNLSENSISGSYISAIESAGGTPIVIPIVQNEACLEDSLEIIDGLLLSGGVDIDPVYFGEEAKPGLGRVDADRDRVEIYLTTNALKKDIPILGICRGIQILNVAAGGTLYQDINTDLNNNILKHRQTAQGWHGTHSIDVKEGSRLLDILGQPTIRVNSFHHQSVKKLAPNFKISAVALDGIIEGIESTNRRFSIGVQFHPELMWQNNPPISAIFTAFVNAARGYKQER
jgi:putative glutamine amidotransferase